MGIHFYWEEAYSVNNEEIDGQHKEIFKIVNSMTDEIDIGELNRAIMTLYKHTRNHFAAEEHMMLEVGFPRRAEHQALHEDLLSKLNAICLVSFSDRDSVHAFVRFMYEWVIDHIMSHDLEYARFIKTNGPGADQRSKTLESADRRR